MNQQPWDKPIIAVIGSREPTEQQEIEVVKLMEEFDQRECRIITGCAYGIDAVAAMTGHNLGIEIIGCTPWHTYNKAIQKFCDWIVTLEDLPDHVIEAAYDSVKIHHPRPSLLSPGAWKLHARNFIILNWASQVIAAPSNKPGGGGTGQGIRLAQSKGIQTTIVHP